MADKYMSDEFTCPLAGYILQGVLDKELNECRNEDLTVKAGIKRVDRIRETIDIFLQEQMHPEVGKPMLSAEEYKNITTICRDCYNSRLGGNKELPRDIQGFKEYGIDF